MAENWRSATAAEVQAGDVVRMPSGEVLTIARVEPAFFGRPEMVAFIEDTPQRWYKQPSMVDAELEIRIDN
jgi:hypothetical protein